MGLWCDNLGRIAKPLGVNLHDCSINARLWVRSLTEKTPNKHPYDIFITTTLICTILECLIVKKKVSFRQDSGSK